MKEFSQALFVGRNLSFLLLLANWLCSGKLETTYKNI